MQCVGGDHMRPGSHLARAGRCTPAAMRLLGAGLLGVCIALFSAGLVGPAVAQPPDPARAPAPPAAAPTWTFSYTGALQTFVVPGGVTQLVVDARGGQGGRPGQPGSGAGGPGGRTTALLPVTPGQTLSIQVGGVGQDTGGGGWGYGRGGAGGVNAPGLTGGGGGGGSAVLIG